MTRITGSCVSPYLPKSGPVYVFIVGEAPGPRGADKSGIPFFGDAAGQPLYGLLQEIGAVDMPPQVAQLKWDGAVFVANNLAPVMHGIALGNAYDRCPTDDGVRFRSPTRGELESALNIERIRRELRMLQERGLTGVVTLGRVAARAMNQALHDDEFNALICRSVPHPSAQGLLSMAPERGRGARMDQLKQEWKQRCRAAILDAGYPVPERSDSGESDV